MSPRLLGLITLVATVVIDQTDKLWMLFVYRISDHQPVHIGPFLDLIVAWNPGVSYSLLRATTDIERYLLLALAFAAITLLFAWLWRARSRPTAFALGLIIGGAMGNAYDRWAYGAVADFFRFHVGDLSWYVFNLAMWRSSAASRCSSWNRCFRRRLPGRSGRKTRSSPTEKGRPFRPAHKLPRRQSL
jgi:signal peptidase II